MPAQNNENSAAAKGNATKRRIERAAVALFAERGIDAVTTREIAGGSGVSEGALYRHYPGKAALAEALFFAIHRQLAREISDAARNFTSLEDQTRAIVAAYCNAADRDWDLFSYHLLVAHRFLPALRQAGKAETESPVAKVEAIIAAAMEKGAVPRGDASIKAAMALGVVMQTALHKYYGRITGEMKTHQPALEQAVLAVLTS